MNNSSLPEVDDGSDDLHYYYEGRPLAESIAVITLCSSAAFASTLTACALCRGSGAPLRVPDLHLLSVCASDLLSALAVVPLAAPGVAPPACALSGYLHVTLCAARAYTLMWLAVDRYLAARRPGRYDALQTRARCQCRVLFSWVAAACLCAPPLLGGAHFRRRGALLCLPDVRGGTLLPYALTVGCLVLLPSALTALYSYCRVFAVRAPAGDPSYHVTAFLITCEFAVLWLPWAAAAGSLGHDPDGGFWLLFAGESHILWAPLTILLACRRCREGLAVLRCSKSAEAPDPV